MKYADTSPDGSAALDLKVAIKEDLMNAAASDGCS
jgi:hypothetical protein